MHAAVTPELVCAGGAELAEGPVWHAGALWWVDIVAGTLNRLDCSSGKNAAHATGDFLGAVVPCADGRWLLARRRDLAFLDWETRSLTSFASGPATIASSHRFNDGKCDARGRLWVGTLSLEGARDECSLFVAGVDGVLRPALTRVSLANGMAWSPRGDMYYFIDTLTRRVDRFAFDAERERLDERSPLIVFDETDGWPDGMTCDAEGHLWIACWGGGCVWRVHGVTGRKLARISLPVSQVSSCTFGGAGMRTLFITSAWQGFDEARRRAEPLAGSVFAVETSTVGFASNLFSNE